MRITNHAGLPDAIVRAVENDAYSRGRSDFTVTELIGPAQQARLIKAHWEELEEDVSDHIWALLGKAVHFILERANVKDTVEKRLYCNIEQDNKEYLIGGAFDRLAITDDTLTDYKVSSVWSYVFEGGKPKAEWVAQLNMLRHICLENGHNVKKAEVVLIFRDWSKLEARRNPDYPQQQVITLEVPLWPQKETVSFIKERIVAHTRIPPKGCTDEERWMKPTKYALMKKGRQRAVKLFDDREAADKAAAEDKALYVEQRPGANTRCESYCAVADFCQQYKSIRENPL